MSVSTSVVGSRYIERGQTRYSHVVNCQSSEMPCSAFVGRFKFSGGHSSEDEADDYKDATLKQLIDLKWKSCYVEPPRPTPPTGYDL